MTPQRILVTGATGLLGSHLTAALSSRHQVTGLDRHPWWGPEPREILQGQGKKHLGQIIQADHGQPIRLLHIAGHFGEKAVRRQPDGTAQPAPHPFA